MEIKSTTHLNITTPFEMYLLCQSYGDYTRFDSEVNATTHLVREFNEGKGYKFTPDIFSIVETTPTGTSLITTLSYRENHTPEDLEVLTKMMEDSHQRCLDILVEEVNIDYLE